MFIVPGCNFLNLLFSGLTVFDHLHCHPVLSICLVDVYYLVEPLEELITRSTDDMIKVRNLGKKSLEEVIGKLKDLGLSLKEASAN